MSIRIRLLAVVAGALLAATGCGASCDDACTAIADCSKALGSPSDQPQAECVSSCEADTSCGDNKQEFLDCVADMECTDQSTALAELLSCAAKCPGALN